MRKRLCSGFPFTLKKFSSLSFGKIRSGFVGEGDERRSVERHISSGETYFESHQYVMVRTNLRFIIKTKSKICVINCFNPEDQF